MRTAYTKHFIKSYEYATGDRLTGFRRYINDVISGGGGTQSKGQGHSQHADTEADRIVAIFKDGNFTQEDLRQLKLKLALSANKRLPNETGPGPRFESWDELKHTLVQTAPLRNNTNYLESASGVRFGIGAEHAEGGGDASVLTDDDYGEEDGMVTDDSSVSSEETPPMHQDIADIVNESMSTPERVDQIAREIDLIETTTVAAERRTIREVQTLAQADPRADAAARRELMYYVSKVLALDWKAMRKKSDNSMILFQTISMFVMSKFDKTTAAKIVALLMRFFFTT
jgi:hypothetical protein